MATDEVTKRRNSIQKLREQIAQEEHKASAAAAEADQEVALVTLDREEERLKAELEAWKANNSKKSVKEQVRAVTGEPQPVNLTAEAAEKE